MKVKNGGCGVKRMCEIQLAALLSCSRNWAGSAQKVSNSSDQKHCCQSCFFRPNAKMLQGVCWVPIWATATDRNKLLKQYI